MLLKGDERLGKNDEMVKAAGNAGKDAFASNPVCTGATGNESGVKQMRGLNRIKTWTRLKFKHLKNKLDVVATKEIKFTWGILFGRKVCRTIYISVLRRFAGNESEKNY